MTTLDQTWVPFNNLMLRHIYNVLLICSDYDRFLIEEDGRVEEELYHEYTQLGLSNPPKITHAPDAESALVLLENRPFELVITMLDIGPEKMDDLALGIKSRYPDMPVIALSPSPGHHRNKSLKHASGKSFDYVFYWQGNPSIFLAMVKLVEDAMNAPHDTSVADVPVILLVEDSVRYYSSFLPLLYTSLITENRTSILEALNTWGRTLRMRGRPKILLARTYEDAYGLYEKYRHAMLGVISDVDFHCDGQPNPNAGLVLCRSIRENSPDLPFLLQSTRDDVREKAEDAGATFLWKRDPSLVAELRMYMRREYGFGPFVFRDPSTGAVVAQAETMKDLQHLLPSIPDDSFAWHCRRNDISKWLRSQSLYRLATKIKTRTLGSYDSVRDEKLRVASIIKDYRMERNKGVIAQFSPSSFDETSYFTRIGRGSLGGKGRGLAFIDMELRSSGIVENYPRMSVSIPRTIVIATDIYEQFIEQHCLHEMAYGSYSDHEILETFLSHPLPSRLTNDLQAILKILDAPLSIRSSSLLEDSYSQPFAGVYQTCMIANRGSEQERFDELSQAVRCVWASVFFSKAREYLAATNHVPEEEKMAVIIQNIVGAAYGDYWYPHVSGVARSLNFYPLPGESPHDGIGAIAFGFGKSVVDGEVSFRFSPRHPHRPVNNLDGAARSSQEAFYALALNKPFNPISGNHDNLLLLPLSWAAENHPRSLAAIASTYDGDTGEISESFMSRGTKVITFNGILKYDAFPLASIVHDVLELGTRAMNGSVEIEFAMNLSPLREMPEFSLLQIRPIVAGSENEDVAIDDEDRKKAVIHSRAVMGNGRIEHVRNIIMIKPGSFDTTRTMEMVRELRELNASFSRTDGDYVLVVAGRLGSSDPWLGIPAVWSDISQARVIVETGLPSIHVEPSQGTHFFQNITSFGTVYMTVNPSFGDGTCDFTALSSLPRIRETEYFLHVQSSADLDIRVKGRDQEGVVLLP
ncbi:PEP/pyruvate-binding domain-containing protein [Parasphaerochaeta coccoides]|uniref:Pyruvate phosphate dikinase PEP/pyruvate-binding protein n=1 Tax=Parasphaerochaeta coccoides (strain ATCC BAA-1237 / DSM 17374 / SPN1) TaxID=760011 RepID=F4GLW6_PARC1|nr:PEP/pyruvate-binding domain-containing protein [Parasphaerochaeta coccoides]AEC03007.1 pyruvate phosphate dikinase PEP/pyruvate-binding protein [Parasphaerochaeta coccoides DSM 17374]